MAGVVSPLFKFVPADPVAEAIQSLRRQFERMLYTPSEHTDDPATFEGLDKLINTGYVTVASYCEWGEGDGTRK